MSELLKGIDLNLAMQGLGLLSQPKEPESPGFIRSAADTGLALGKGVVTGAKMISDAFGAENTVSQGMGTARDWLAGMESEYSKWEQQQSAAEMEAAKGTGFMNEVGAAINSFKRRPLDMIVEAAGTSLPTLAAALLPGGQGAVAVRIGAMIGMGGVQGAGSVKGQIHKEVEQAWLKSGASPEQAKLRADEAQEYLGTNQGQIALGTALGAAAGVIGAEGSILAKRILARAGSEAAEAVAKKPASLMGKALEYGKEGLKEGLPEAFQGGQEAYAGGSAVRNEGFDVNPWDGVAGGAALEGLAGFGMGAAANALPSAKPDPLQRIADAKTGSEAIAAFNESSNDLTKPGGAGAVVSQAALLAGSTSPADPLTEPTATVVDSPFADRVLEVRSQLANDTDRQLLREKVGDQAINEAAYYLGLADDASNGLPDKTRENMLAMAEAILDRGRVRDSSRQEAGDPLAPRPGEPERIGGESLLRIGMDEGPARIGLDGTPTDTMVVDAAGNASPRTRAEEISIMQRAREREGLGQQAPSRQPGAALRPDGLPALGYDTAPTGTLRVDGQGNAAPETRADRINTRQALAERTDLGQQAPARQPGAELRPSGPLALGYDTTPTGALRVDGQGNVLPETRADQINTRQAQAERESLGQQTPRGGAPAPAPAPGPRSLLQIAQDKTTTDRMVVDAAGNARPELRTEQVARDNETAAQARARQLAADLGLTPDVIRAQQLRQGGKPDAGGDEAQPGGVGGNGGPGPRTPPGSGGMVSNGGTLPAIPANRADGGDGAGQGATGQAGALSGPTASWVIREKGTGRVILETFDKKKVDALNTQKYEAVPIREHLAGLSQKSGGEQFDGAQAQPGGTPGEGAGGSRPTPGPPSAETGNATQDLLAPSGKPYATKSGAVVRAKREGGEPVQVDGGWAVRVAKPGADIAGADLDADWTAFAAESGTKGVPRAEMPQIKAEHRGAMTQFLAARGIAHEADEVDASTLKPTQAEFSPGKVRKALGYEGGERAILVSEDGHVVDGHHQWVAARYAKKPVKVIRLKAPIEQVLEQVRQFPSATASEGAASTPPANKALAKKANPNRNVNPERDTLLQAVAKLGGIRRDALSRFGLVPEELKHKVKIGNLLATPFRVKGGRDLDAMREVLAEAGYLDGVAEEDQMAALEEAIKDELGGKERLATAGMIRQTEERAREDAEADAEETARMLAEEDAAERAAIMAENDLSQAEAAAISAAQLDALDDALESAERGGNDPDALRAMGFTEEEINEFNAQQAQPSRASPGEGGNQEDSSDVARPSAAPGGTGEGQARAGEGRQQGLNDGAGEADGLLARQTEADLAEQAKRQEAADKAERAEQKRLADRDKANAELGEFRLTGSDSPRDVGAAAGQGDMFDTPAEEPRATAKPTAEPAADIEPEQYAQLEGATVEQEVRIEETGQTGTLRLDAAKALRQLDERRKALDSLKACIGRTA